MKVGVGQPGGVEPTVLRVREACMQQRIKADRVRIATSEGSASYSTATSVTSLTRSTASSLYLSAHTRKGEPHGGSPERVHSSWYNPREVTITQTRIDYSTTKSSNKTGNYY